MKELISKELLNEVLGVNDISGIYSDIAEENEITYTQYANMVRGTRTTDINIHELAHKCKEFALSEGWYLNAYFTKNEGAYCDAIKPPLNEEIHTEATTEPEAVFKACQWILDNQS